jgi:hypothetical protein
MSDLRRYIVPLYISESPIRVVAEGGEVVVRSDSPISVVTQRVGVAKSETYRWRPLLNAIRAEVDALYPHHFSAGAVRIDDDSFHLPRK